jgi:hypothetical protein
VEILTNVLPKDEFRTELLDAVAHLAKLGVAHVAVSFGFTPDAPDLDDVGVGHSVAVADVASFIAERERAKGFHLGTNDCWIAASALDARFLFCNDRDVHLTSDSDMLLNAVRARWRAKGFNVYPDDLSKQNG